MIVELEDFTEWCDSVEARMARLEALYFTRNQYTAAFRRLETGQEEFRLGQAELRLGQAQLQTGIQTIANLLKPAVSDEKAS